MTLTLSNLTSQSKVRGSVNYIRKEFRNEFRTQLPILQICPEIACQKAVNLQKKGLHDINFVK